MPRTLFARCNGRHLGLGSVEAARLGARRELELELEGRLSGRAWPASSAGGRWTLGKLGKLGELGACPIPPLDHWTIITMLLAASKPNTYCVNVSPGLALSPSTHVPISVYTRS